MTTVLVQTPGANLSARGGRLLVETGEGTREVPLGHVSELLIVGNACVSTAVLRDLAERGVPVHFLWGESRVVGSVWGPLDGRLEALRVQFGASGEGRLAVARALVAGKVRNSQWALRRLGRAERLDSSGVASATDMEALRGHEGLVARTYFGAVAESLPGWGFAGRTYRPTPDPVNAALSFAYTLLLGRTLAAVARAGLHPALGTLHVSHGRRPALALDVMEPFRAPVCDVLVVGLLRSGRLRVDRFEQDGAGAVRLGHTGCAVVAETLAERVRSWGLEVALLRQVRAVLDGWQGQPCPVWVPPARP